MAKTHVVGAGLGGLVAAVNLARQGKEVLVLDAGNGIGGIRGFHPSIHVTPMDMGFLKNYTGLDFSGSARVLDKMWKLGAWGDEYMFYGKDGLHLETVLYGIERGHSKTSIDRFLFDEARKAGVEFSFSTYVKNPNELPPGSVLASGLYPEMFDALKIPYEEVHGFYFCGPMKNREKDDVLLFAGDFCTDYFYSVAMNGFYYGLIFKRGAMDYGKLLDMEKILKEREGEIHSWRPFICRVPTRRFFQPRLFAGKHILAGSLTGMMDPLLLFGIHGALLAGKLGATAVTDPLRARKEFAALNHGYRRSWLTRKALDLIPHDSWGSVYRFLRYDLEGFFKRYGYYFKPLLGFMDKGVPGYMPGYIVENIPKTILPQGRAERFDKLLDLAGRAVPARHIPRAVEGVKRHYRDAA